MPSLCLDARPDESGQFSEQHALDALASQREKRDRLDVRIQKRRIGPNRFRWQTDPRARERKRRVSPARVTGMTDSVGIQPAQRPWQADSVGGDGIHKGADIQRAVIANRPARRMPIPLWPERHGFRLSRLLTVKRAWVDT